MKWWVAQIKLVESVKVPHAQLLCFPGLVKVVQRVDGAHLVKTIVLCSRMMTWKKVKWRTPVTGRWGLVPPADSSWKVIVCVGPLRTIHVTLAFPGLSVIRGSCYARLFLGPDSTVGGNGDEISSEQQTLYWPFPLFKNWREASLGIFTVWFPTHCLQQTHGCNKW